MRYWELPITKLFTDIHFYFVAGEQLRKATKKLGKDLDEPKLKELLSKYAKCLNSFKKIRGMLEHLADQQIGNPKVYGDLGNIDDKGYHFGEKYYPFYTDKVRQLQGELCDYFLQKTLLVLHVT